MKLLRSLSGIVVLGLAAWLLVALFGSPPAEAEPLSFTSSQQCAECHAGVYEEWDESWHSESWVDPEVRALSRDFANADCIDCHAPRPIFETGIGNRVLPRTARRVEGVDCIACHMLPDGSVAGTLTNSKAPCRPVGRRELVDPLFCAGCHDQHKTVQQWLASDYPEQGQDCVACHMPYRDGDPANGRDHTMHGGHSVEMLRAAVELRGAREDGVWVVEVENVGAGHNYPTDERSRASDVFWRPAGETTWRHLYRFRNPYRHEVGLEDTELPAHATQRLPVDDPGARGAIEVALFYKLSPYWADPENPDPDSEATLVHRIELEP